MKAKTAMIIGAAITGGLYYLLPKKTITKTVVVNTPENEDVSDVFKKCTNIEYSMDNLLGFISVLDETIEEIKRDMEVTDSVNKKLGYVDVINSIIEDSSLYSSQKRELIDVIKTDGSSTYYGIVTTILNNDDFYTSQKRDFIKGIKIK